MEKNQIVIESPNYYAILPANVRYDNRLKANEKLLYSEITALSNKDGACYAANKYFAKLYDVETETISRWIKHLKELDYISVEITYKDGTKEIHQRIIRIKENAINFMPEHDEGVLTKKSIGYCSKNQGGIDKKVKDNNTSINNKKRKYIKEKKEDYLAIVKKVISYLNEKTGSKYKDTTESTQSKIIARLNECFMLDDFIVVIDKKSKEWMGTEYQKYLRPETLFGTKFESYLNQQDIPKVASNNRRVAPIPTWYDKKLEKEESTPEEIQELEELLKDFR